MILFVGIPSEPPIAMAIKSAEKKKNPFVVFNQRHAHFYELMIKMKEGKLTGILRIEGRDYPLEQFTGVYFRLMQPEMLPEFKENVFHKISIKDMNKSKIIQNQLLKWIESCSARVLNLGSSSISNISKPYQSQLIARCGFKVPPTLVTSDMEEVIEFLKIENEIIFKSISGIRSIVKKFEGQHLLKLKNLKYLPVQFQKKLLGRNIRVHVVGKFVFPTLIDSVSVDYRYSEEENAETILSKYTLPKTIINSCLALSQSLKLPLCGIDLFETETGEYYCFEVNPSPGYSYYQGHTGQNISGAIIKYLING
ncbi:MAG TPA: hypothetical protein PKX92_01750 [Edaphocola sp.]|nr:hypothetical protein [Edaphocola sp.]